jgi:L,D-peptidoglycan transpeptidase YkuD (ErfK/YbiS/YcfS/YnhG family)
MKKGQTGALSFEEMKRPDGLYRYGIVIGYNGNPVVKGLGSAIFLHVWKGRDIPTSGCVALAEEDVVAILARLDPSRQPLCLWGIVNSEKNHAHRKNSCYTNF